jgi:hypothetical protein
MIERHCRPLLDLLNEDLKKLQRQSYGSHGGSWFPMALGKYKVHMRVYIYTHYIHINQPKMGVEPAYIRILINPHMFNL